jgi:hypothetical protein
MAASTSTNRPAVLAPRTPLAFGLCTAVAALTTLAPRAVVAGDVLPVTSCADDGGAGTLRSVAATATKGATIDLGALTCGSITLLDGAIAPASGTFTLRGPGRDRLTIDGNGQDRVLTGDNVTIEGLTLANGRVEGDDAEGGCVDATLGVVLRASRVTSCRAYGDRLAVGGGIAAGYYVHLYDSIVSDNIAGANHVYGGGVSAKYDGVIAENSTISGNSAEGAAYGGGVFAMGVSEVSHSTISGNLSTLRGGGLYCLRSWIGFGTCLVVDSTISGNTAAVEGGGLVASDVSVLIASSTIAFNTAMLQNVGGFLFTSRDGTPHGQGVTLESSIFASNEAAESALSPDLDTNLTPTPVVAGTDNLIAVIGNLEPGYVSADPLLAPLAANGGPTLTHALLPGSPAIDAGNNAGEQPTDQRGAPRLAGAAPDIGAFEVQPDAIFADGFD